MLALAALGRESRWVSMAQGTTPGPRDVTGRKTSPQKEEELLAGLCFVYREAWAVVRRVRPLSWVGMPTDMTAQRVKEYMHQNISPMGHSGEKMSRGQISLRNTPNSPPLLGDSQCIVAFSRL